MAKKYQTNNDEYFNNAETSRTRWYQLASETNEKSKMKAPQTESSKDWHDLSEQSKSQKNTIKTLNNVFQNATMAKSAICAVLESITNEKFKIMLNDQIDKYDEFISKSKKYAQELDTELVEENTIGRFFTNANIKIKLLTNKSSEAIAEMLLLGTTMGIIDLGKVLRHTPEVNDKTLKLAKELLIFEEDKVELMKYYL